MSNDDLDAYIEQAGDVNFVNNDGDTALKKVSRDGDARAVKHLLSKGADTSIVDEMGQSILAWGIYSGDYLTILTLLEAGADIDFQTAQGVTPVHMALFNKVSSTIFKLLLRYNPNLDLSAYRDGSVRDMVKAKYSQYSPLIIEHEKNKKIGKYAALLGDD